jgi:hypothetical protein
MSKVASSLDISSAAAITYARLKLEEVFADTSEKTNHHPGKDHQDHTQQKTYN